MRSIDLDQYWPKPRAAHQSQRPTAGDDAAPHDESDDTQGLGPHAEGFDAFAGETHIGFEHDKAYVASDTDLADNDLAGEDREDHDLADHDLSIYAADRYAPGDFEPSVDVQPRGDGIAPAATADSVADDENTPPPPAQQNVAPAPFPAAVASAKGTPHALGPPIWGGLGFVAGMLAWHVVGFWIFVSDVVFNGDDGNLKAEESLPDLATSNSSKIVVRVPKPASAKGDSGAPRCVELAINRQSGLTQSIPCAGGERVMRDAGFARRRDRASLQPRLQDAAAWSNTTAVNLDVVDAGGTPKASDAAVNTLETGSLQASDFEIAIRP